MGTPGPEADKICKCTSEKIVAADRSSAIAALTAVNAALAKGTMLDATALSPDIAKGMNAVMEAQTQCM
ncbi:MAG: hypothetical protein GC191_13750 [Azospirillum sp.]|nr:hypothetical protein [Azospirillum sp.]